MYGDPKLLQASLSLNVLAVSLRPFAMHDGDESSFTPADLPQRRSSLGDGGPSSSTSSILAHEEHREGTGDVNRAPDGPEGDSQIESHPAPPASTSADFNNSLPVLPPAPVSSVLPGDDEPALTYFPSAYSGRISFIPPPNYNGVQHVSGAFCPRGAASPVYPTPSIVRSLQHQGTVVGDRTTACDWGSGVPGSPKRFSRADSSLRVQQVSVSPTMAGSPGAHDFQISGGSLQQQGTTSSVNAPSASSAFWGNGAEVAFSTNSSPLQSSRVSAVGGGLSEAMRRKLGSEAGGKSGAGYFIPIVGEPAPATGFGSKGGKIMNHTLGTPWSSTMEGASEVEKVALPVGEAVSTEPMRLSPQTKVVPYVQGGDSSTAVDRYGERPVPPSLLASKSENEKQYIEELNAVDHAGAVSISKMPYVPLPLLERLHMHHVHGLRAPPRTHFLDSLFPLIRVRTRRGPVGVCDVGTLDLKQFVRRLQLALSGYYDDMKRLVGPPDVTFPSMDICAPSARPPVPVVYQLVSAPNCPHCGYQLLLKSAAPLPAFLQAAEVAQLPPPQYTGQHAEWRCVTSRGRNMTGG